MIYKGNKKTITSSWKSKWKRYKANRHHMWMGNRLMVGHRTLTPFVQVRILVPQGVWLRSRETVSRRAHNPKIGGSIPSSATKLIGSSLIGRASDSESGGYRFESYLPSIKSTSAGMVELVDTLGLEPSALRCAGSSPVPGIWLSYEYKNLNFVVW